MAKRRSLQEDTVALKTKIKEGLAKSESSEGIQALRALRKRLKRTQRKIQTAKKREAARNTKKAEPEK